MVKVTGQSSRSPGKLTGGKTFSAVRARYDARQPRSVDKQT